jgi:hypothetical protein
MDATLVNTCETMPFGAASGRVNVILSFSQLRKHSYRRVLLSLVATAESERVYVKPEKRCVPSHDVLEVTAVIFSLVPSICSTMVYW